MALSVVRPNGDAVDADFSEACSIDEVRRRVAGSLGVEPRSMQLLQNATILTDKAELADYASTITAVVVREPSWLPLHKYMHEGKEVLQITGSSVYGQRSRVHYADGTSTAYPGYTDLDAVIEHFGFIVYKGRDNDRYYGGEYFTAVPQEDPTDWEAHVAPIVDYQKVQSMLPWHCAVHL